MKKVLVCISLMLLSMLAMAITPEELADSLNTWCDFPQSVPPVKVQQIRQYSKEVRVQTNKTLSGKGMTAEETKQLKSMVARWVSTGRNSVRANQVKIYSDGYEIGELAVKECPLTTRPVQADLSGKTIVLWASHGRYYNRKQERWVWQRARLWGTVEDRLTTEYMVRLKRLLEQSGAKVLMPRPSPEEEKGKETGRSGLPRWMESSAEYLRAEGYPEHIWNGVKYLPKQSKAHKENPEYYNDILCRPLWVNYLTDTLRTPVDLVVALHTDGGEIAGDSSSIGTLVIYYDRNDRNQKVLRDGRSRMKVNRQIAYNLQQSLVHEMRENCNPGWGMRQVMNANYGEIRIPNVPSVIVEIGSHQDMTDAQYLLMPEAMDRIAMGLYKGIAMSLAPNDIRSLPQPDTNQLSTRQMGPVTIIDAFTRTCGPEWYRDSRSAGIVPGRYGIADSVSYSLIGQQHNYDRQSVWKSDDETGWGMCDTRWQHIVVKGNTHDYAEQHAAVWAQLPKTQPQTLDVILGQQLEVPTWVNDSIARGKRMVVSGAYIGKGPMVRERQIVSQIPSSQERTYTIETEPNERVLYCNESRSLKKKDGDVVLYRWSESGLPAIIRRGNCILIGTMLESIVDWQELMKELIYE